jgi:uncharacterized RDD family membrane protein YckC
MDRRFDEVDLLTVPDLAPAVVSRPAVEATPTFAVAPRWRRFLALAIDISLFVALALVLSPLLPPQRDLFVALEEAWPIFLGGAGFLLLLSYYYFTGSWLIWGRTIGSAIFDLRVVSDDGAALTARAVSRRWLATLLSLASAGAGFLPALLPSARTLGDRFSSTHSVRV